MTVALLDVFFPFSPPLTTRAPAILAVKRSSPRAALCVRPSDDHPGAVCHLSAWLAAQRAVAGSGTLPRLHVELKRYHECRGSSYGSALPHTGVSAATPQAPTGTRDGEGQIWPRPRCRHERAENGQGAAAAPFSLLPHVPCASVNAVAARRRAAHVRPRSAAPRFR